MGPTAQEPTESIAGLVERVTFFNEENGFAVLKVKCAGHREPVSVIGSLPSVSPGEWLTAEGRWMQDREFGRQFRAQLLRSTPPTTREGIEKYLGSGMVKGIGPVYAKKLVGRFGEQIFDIIENYSARLQEVEGIGPQRRRRIKDAWAEQKIIREIMVFLHSQGVSTSRAVRIYKTYGEKAVEKVRANPYALARDIPGIGFVTADQIAQKVGIPHDSVLRARAGLRHVLLEANGAGHCALPVSALKEAAGELLLVGARIVDEALEREILDRDLLLEKVGGEPLVYLPAVSRAEDGIASRIAALCRQPAAYPPIDIEKALQWCRERTGKELAPTQREALRMSLAHRVLIITGGPGVGKTTLLRTLLLILRAKQVRCLLCAPTGRAAKRLAEATGLAARTIHRLLEVDPARGGFTRHESRPLECDLLVVDETSMVDVLLMHHMLRALPANAHLLLVGDADQLPSVGPGLVLRNLIESRLVPVAALTEVFRQAANSRIILNAHRINQGRPPELPAKAEESDFYFLERAEPDAISRTVTELVKRRLPQKYGLDSIGDIQVLSPMNRGGLGIRELNLRLQAELNPARAGEPVVEKFGWQFRVGDKVIQTENNYDKEVFNGDIGRIVRIDSVEREAGISFDGREVAYDFGELDEIALAYAITIHKSQGSEFPAVVIPLATQHYLLLQRNLLYTAVTRGKRLVVLVGEPRAVNLAVRNNETRQRFTGLPARLRNALLCE